jgi:hypothetical protein
MQNTDFMARMPAPTASAAAADILIAACQRSFALQAEMFDEVVNRSLEQSRQAIADPRAAGAALQGAWMQPNAVIEPVWRCGVGLMTVCQNAAAAMVTLVTAQLRGADEEIENLSRDAHHEVERTAATAAAAAGAAMSHGLAAAGRIGEHNMQQATEAMSQGLAAIGRIGEHHVQQATEAMDAGIEETRAQAEAQAQARSTRAAAATASTGRGSRAGTRTGGRAAGSRTRH